MPTRILRDWTDSFVIDELDAKAERFFVRLIMKADDFGRFHADPRMLRSMCFPLRSDVRDTDISRWLAECEKAGLIRCYADDRGRPLLEIVNFGQRQRTESKFPSPDDCQTNDRKPPTNDGLVGGVGEGGDEGDVRPAVEDAGKDKGRVLPSGWRQWSKDRQKTTRVLRNNRLMERIGRWFGRKPETLWTVQEAGLLADLNPPIEEIELLEPRYLAVIDKDRDFRRRALVTLLANWTEEIDKTRTETA